jgi:hypothetical protein
MTWNYRIIKRTAKDEPEYYLVDSGSHPIDISNPNWREV